MLRQGIDICFSYGLVKGSMLKANSWPHNILWKVHLQSCFVPSHSPNICYVNSFFQNNNAWHIETNNSPTARKSIFGNSTFLSNGFHIARIFCPLDSSEMIQGKSLEFAFPSGFLELSSSPSMFHIEEK